jgi:APA family basic amino acid/polyamine antiporter
MTRETLAREINLVDATMIVVSGVIGGGIFFTPAAVASKLPHAGWIMAVWTLGALISYAGALTYAELASRYPSAGGHYVYIREAFGRLWAFLYGWMLLAIIATGALASLALAFAGYLARFIDLSDIEQKMVGVLLIVALSVVNWFGVKPGARTNTVLTTIKVAAFAALIAIGLFGEVQPHTSSNTPLGGISLLAAFGAALVPVLFSYGGWQQLNFVAGEVKEAERRIPLALAMGVSVVAVVYLGFNWIYIRTLGVQGMAASSALASDAAEVMIGSGGARLVTILITISILAFSNVVVMVTPRVFYALAQDGAFLNGLSRLHPKYRTPTRAIILQGIWTTLLIVVGNIGALVNGVVFADWIFFGLGGASIFVIRKLSTAPTASYRVPLYPILPAFFVLAAAGAVLSAVIAYPFESLLGVLVMGAGALLWASAERKRAATLT